MFAGHLGGPAAIICLQGKRPASLAGQKKHYSEGEAKIGVMEISRSPTTAELPGRETGNRDRRVEKTIRQQPFPEICP